ncbi:MAG: hypothetical protein JWM96_97 [Alphaproteobacteria bacterium]|nr:hypothetical protein [Alphaproteobacteria bacterium]
MSVEIRPRTAQDREAIETVLEPRLNAIGKGFFALSVFLTAMHLLQLYENGPQQKLLIRMALLVIFIAVFYFFILRASRNAVKDSSKEVLVGEFRSFDLKRGDLVLMVDGKKRYLLTKIHAPGLHPVREIEMMQPGDKVYVEKPQGRNSFIFALRRDV